MATFTQIKEFLNSKSIKFDSIELPAVARSVDEVVRLSGGQINENEIVKTLIVKARTGEFLACVLKGRDRLRSDAMERLATKGEVFQIAGVEFGAVCPILLVIPVIIDKKVAELKRVNMGSGDLLKGIEMDFGDLLKVLPEYTIEEIT